jgi:hypothetical protein
MAYSVEVIADAPSVFLKLDDTASPLVDSSGNAHVQTDTATLSYSQPGISTEITSSVLFTGAGIDEDFGSSTAYTSTTVELWYKSTTGTGCLWTSRGTTGGGFTLFIGPTGAGFGAAGRISWGYDGAGAYLGACTNATFHDGKWHHIVATFSRASGAIIANDFIIYVDGAVAAKTNYTIGSGPTVPLTPSRNWISGSHPAGWGGATLNNTYMAMTAIYATALSQSRVSAHRTAAAIPPSPVSVATVYGDVLYSGVSNARVATVYADVLFTNISSARIASTYTDILVRNPPRRKGWGLQ